MSKNIGNSWLVDSGLGDGDRVVVMGSQYVRPGQAVTVQEMVVDDATGKLLSAPGAAGASPAAGKEG